MANPYYDYPIQMVDLSRHQDNPGTEYVPVLDAFEKEQFSAVSVRVGYGNVKDPLYDWFWVNAKGRFQRKSYWYGDYYSHKSMGISNYQWGVIQGNNWKKFQKGDFGEIPGALDCEAYGPVPITITMRKQYNEVMRALAETYDALTGATTEIYCSPGFIPNLYDWARRRTLWAAWYDRTKTKAQIVAECRKKGWLGPIKFWQYASDGDVNFDGIPDGYTFGLETKQFDLNAFIGSSTTLSNVEEWSRYCGTTPTIELPPTEDPVKPVVTLEKTVKIHRVISADGLNIRNTPKGLSGSVVEKWMPIGTEIALMETMIIGSDIWHRIGYKQWCAEKYNGSVFTQPKVV